jgi:hypothetical protein
LKKLITESKHDINVLCVISEQEYIPVCAEFGFHWVFALNDPLGEKINAGILKALTFEFDYLMMMNSDSVIRVDLIDRWYDEFFNKKEEFFGVNKVTYLDSETGDARDYVYDFSILGVAKCIRRDVVERAFKERGILYQPQRNKGLDDSVYDTLMKIGVYPKRVNYQGQLVYDIKSEVNIWPWKHFENKGKKVDSELCFKVA